MIHPVFRILLLPAFIAAVFFGYAQGTDFLSPLIEPSALKNFAAAYGVPRKGIGSLVILNLMLPHFLVVACISFVFSTLAVRVYREDALLVALLTSLPIVAIRFYELLRPISLDYFPSVVSFIMSAFEIGSFCILLCGGTWLVSRRRRAAAMAASEKTPDQI